MTYEYECSECKSRFERRESMRAPPDPTCVSCGKPTAVRLITGGCGFIMRGMPSRAGLGAGWRPDLHGE